MSRGSLWLFLLLCLTLTYVQFCQSRRGQSRQELNRFDDDNDDEDVTWNKFVNGYHKNFRDTKRRRIFGDNFQKVRRHNELFKKGKIGWKRRMHKLSDLSREEFLKSRCGTK